MKNAHSIKAVLVLFGAVVLAGLSSSAHAQGVPPGTYTQTCNSAFMLDAFTLQANCRQFNGGFETSALDLRTCAGGSDISNNNGFLQCAGFSGVPSGSYLQSCEFVSFSGNNLSANCLSLAGALPFTSLNTGTCASGSDIADATSAANLVQQTARISGLFFYVASLHSAPPQQAPNWHAGKKMPVQTCASCTSPSSLPQAKEGRAGLSACCCSGCPPRRA
jgi:hypothetical protein